MIRSAQDEHRIEGMVWLATNKTPGILDHTPSKAKRQILVNRVIYAQLMEVVRAPALRKVG